MSELAFDRSAHRQVSRVVSHVAVLYVVVGAAAGAGVATAALAADDASRWEASLVLLLCFMAGLKAMMAVAALGLAQWRLRQSADIRLTSAYIVAVACMAAAPGLIWSLAHIALGAALFHTGLLLALVVALRDNGAYALRSRLAPPTRR